jgi:protein required for attachment to host cells
VPVATNPPPFGVDKGRARRGLPVSTIAPQIDPAQREPRPRIQGEAAMSKYRILVADQAQAIFYDATALDAAPQEVARITDPLARLHDRDFASERPGRVRESVGGARHAIQRPETPRRTEAVRFARRIARRLDDARRKDEFDHLVVCAGAPFLGVMRHALSGPTRARVVHEIRKDLVHSTPADLARQIAMKAAVS